MLWCARDRRCETWSRILHLATFTHGVELDRRIQLQGSATKRVGQLLQLEACSHVLLACSLSAKRALIGAQPYQRHSSTGCRNIHFNTFMTSVPRSYTHM